MTGMRKVTKSTVAPWATLVLTPGPSSRGRSDGWAVLWPRGPHGVYRYGAFGPEYMARTVYGMDTQYIQCGQAVAALAGCDPAADRCGGGRRAAHWRRQAGCSPTHQGRKMAKAAGPHRQGTPWLSLDASTAAAAPRPCRPTRDRPLRPLRPLRRRRAPTPNQVTVCSCPFVLSYQRQGRPPWMPGGARPEKECLCPRLPQSPAPIARLAPLAQSTDRHADSTPRPSLPRPDSPSIFPHRPAHTPASPANPVRSEHFRPQLAQTNEPSETDPCIDLPRAGASSHAQIRRRPLPSPPAVAQQSVCCDGWVTIRESVLVEAKLGPVLPSPRATVVREGWCMGW